MLLENEQFLFGSSEILSIAATKKYKRQNLKKIGHRQTTDNCYMRITMEINKYI